MHKAETPQVNLNFAVIGARQEKLWAVYKVEGKNTWNNCLWSKTDTITVMYWYL